MGRNAPSMLRFTIEFMESLGNNVQAGIAFKGIVYEGDKPHIVAHLPVEGVDIQD